MGEPAGHALRQRTSELDVDVVICTYRSRHHIGACLDSLRDGGATVRSITVVDNDSDDGTADLAATHDLGVTTVRMGRNAGFARAVNRGIAAGRGRYVFVLNPDTLVAPAVLPELVRFADAHPDAGVVAPRLRYADGRDQLTARAFPTPAAALFGRRSPLTRLWPTNPWSTRFLSGRAHTGPEPFEVDWVSGAAMLVPRAVIERVGAFDEGFFLFWEDADWCRRIRDAGHAVWCLPAVTVTHHEGGSRNSGWSRATISSFHRGAYRYWAKHHAPRPWQPSRWLAAALLAARAAVLLAWATAHRRPSDDRTGPPGLEGTRP
ncbi:glycosyltransferase family 2 protein [Micromonospora sp. NBS 11-29]|uniref:glycosyltransferase family 2 protein n=1 Tax=Micromonospora sp. NBS 11-29 TaxID=1960879 RepID=UPI000B76D720|nr:glycosyltransferase family 2 protein [Micromonospora sp. NBS 11-29]